MGKYVIYVAQTCAVYHKIMVEAESVDAVHDICGAASKDGNKSIFAFMDDLRNRGVGTVSFEETNNEIGDVLYARPLTEELADTKDREE